MRIRQAVPCVAVPASRSIGFSLLELLVVTGIAAVLMALAVPSMGAMLNAQRATALASSFVASLYLARNEAVMHGSRTVLCISADGNRCAATGGWEQGWIVFQDANNNSERDPDEQLLQKYAAASEGVRLRGNAPVARYVSYTSAGSAKLVSGAFQAGTFTLCPNTAGDGAEVRQIILSATGRPRVQKGTATDCP